MHEETVSDNNNLKIKDITNINDIIHTPVRLAMMMFLLPRGKALFTEIQNALELTAGNLSSHTKKLEESGFIQVQKAFIKAKPTTILYLTERGMKAIQEYAHLMTNLLGNMLEQNEKK